MKAYKLTDKNGQTRSQTQWGPGVSHSAKGDCGQPLCSDGWMHFYTNPLIAVLMNPIHAEFKSPKLWECETSGEELHEALKSGCKTLTTIEEIPLPEITLNQKIAFGILCAKEVCTDEAWNQWADRWLNGEDRTKESAAASDAAAINASAYAASYAAADYVVRVANISFAENEDFSRYGGTVAIWVDGNCIAAQSEKKKQKKYSLGYNNKP